MDILRAALASPRLDYLGKSYGTFLGATYADLFPRKVGRFVLDGVVAPDLSSTQVNQGQAEGFETATRAYVADCVKGGGCPLGGSVDAGMQRLRDFLKQLDASPIRVDDPHVPALTEGWGSLGIAAAMYDQGSWGRLTQALQSAFQGNGDDLMALADSYAERSSSGHYSGNMMQVIYAVNCLDRSDSKDLSHYEGEAKAFRGSAPTWGPFLAWSTVPCGFWPVPANNAPKKITRRRQRADRGRGHDPRPRDALRVGQAARRPARQRPPDHARRRRPHGVHEGQRLRRRRRRRLSAGGDRAGRRPEVLTVFCRRSRARFGDPGPHPYTRGSRPRAHAALAQSARAIHS